MSNSGGTLTLPSPTHAHHHHVDVQSGLRTLRRSLSRSPSKFSLVRNATSQSSSDAGSAPPSPSCRRVQSQHFAPSPSHASNAVHAQSPLATPFRPSAKFALRSAKATRSPGGPTKSGGIRSRTSPKSPPVRRALGSVNLNAVTSTPLAAYICAEPATPGPEKASTPRRGSPATRSNSNSTSTTPGKTPNRHSMHLDMTGASQLTRSRFSDANNNANTATASPLKRSDATMGLDQAVSETPNPKRRSTGLNYADLTNALMNHQGTPSPEIQDDSNPEYHWGPPTPAFSGEPSEGPLVSTPTAMPRRTGSLRRSTVQQRTSSERTSWGRRHALQQMAQAQALAQAQASKDAATPFTKGIFSKSVDQGMPPPSRDSPFNSHGPLPNPSAHMLNQHTQQTSRHPLSRTMTTSSSGSSFVDDSPTHIPVVSERSRAPMNWSKSLPLGAIRPQPEREGHSVASVSTPDYKHAKPFEGAFASTGLVSKVNRNPELGPAGAPSGFSAIMPDTPCKKVNGFATYPPPPTSGRSRFKHSRGPFGGPATPFNPSPSRSQNTFGGSPRPSLFTGFERPNHNRRGSILSIHSDDGRSPLDNGSDAQISLGDVPPTPTKHQLLTESSSNLSQLSNESPTANRHLPAPISAVKFGAVRRREAGASCEYNSQEGPCDNRVDEPRDVPNNAACRSLLLPCDHGQPPSNYASVSSFRLTRAKRGSFSTPAPLKTTSNATPSVLVTPTVEVQFAKNHTASPLERLEFAESTTPHTPLDHTAPLDASRLSISQPNDGYLFPVQSERRTIFQPATPTTRHNNLNLFQDRRAITPVHGAPPAELDDALFARFAKVEHLGKGEFSRVYKVAKVEPRSVPAQGGYFTTPTHRTPPSPAPDKVFAVKKLALPLTGDRDRALRRREVQILAALKGCDHIVQLIDSWEESMHLYIQTEFCEEGSLDMFLANIGAKGRLDDFRIWKIMLEIGQGLRHIHAAGFVHLDIKPANVLISFEGTLKIGDFGLATALPCEKGIDIEGDREYLAPEALRSEIDQPADIFSLGLVMLEIAANVKLPDNGATWTALREGDFSEVPMLTNDSTAIVRDATGMPIEDTDRGINDEGITTRSSSRRVYNFRGANRPSNDIFGLARKNELQQPPDFMADAEHVSSLDNIVKSMLAAEPMYRPTVPQLLELDALAWVAARQRAGATVFEGNWGPNEEPAEPMSLDTEMTDV